MTSWTAANQKVLVWWPIRSLLLIVPTENKKKVGGESIANVFSTILVTIELLDNYYYFMMYTVFMFFLNFCFRLFSSNLKLKTENWDHIWTNFLQWVTCLFFCSVSCLKLLITFHLHSWTWFWLFSACETAT